jgi:hypothetical protein
MTQHDEANKQANERRWRGEVAFAHTFGSHSKRKLECPDMLLRCPHHHLSFTFTRLPRRFWGALRFTNPYLPHPPLFSTFAARISFEH